MTRDDLRDDAQQPTEQPAAEQQQQRHAPGKRSTQGESHARTPRRDEQADQDNHGKRQRPAGRKPRQHRSEQRDIDVIAAFERREIRLLQRARDTQHVVAMHLQRCRIEIGADVERRMVVAHIVGEGEVERRKTCADEEREIGVVRQDLVDLRVKRTRRQHGHAFGVEIDETAVAGTRLEQKARSPRAARFHVHDGARARLQRVVLQKGIGAEQAALFAVGDHGDDGMETLGSASLQRTHGFKHGRHTGFVVGCAGAGRYGVVMREQHDRLALARNHIGDDVGDRGTAHIAPAPRRIAGEGAIGFRRHAEFRELIEDARAHRGVFRAADRMRTLGAQDRRQRCFRARRRKACRGRTRRCSTVRIVRVVRQEPHRQCQQREPPGSEHVRVHRPSQRGSFAAPRGWGRLNRRSRWTFGGHVRFV